MQRPLLVGSLLFFTLVVAPGARAGGAPPTPLTESQILGKLIFEDEDLSINRNQGCNVCHGSEVGWTGPEMFLNIHGAVYEGSIPGRFGGRKPPSSAYATFSPIFHLSPLMGGTFVGGNFWDGRATGEKLGNPAADQAQGPFLNPVEQALPSAAEVVRRVCEESDYASLFYEVWGADACDDVDDAYARIALAIADYEASPEVSAFTSKFDAWRAGEAKLSAVEKRGLKLFTGKAKCANCHSIAPQADGTPPLFTDFTYENIGAPKNPENPFYTQPPEINPQGAAWVDLGLGGFLAKRPEYAAYAAANVGKHKIPTLRNVDKRPWPGFVKAYGHNGYFKSLWELVHFYNTRDVLPSCPHGTLGEGVFCWPPPEVRANMSTEVGDLDLTLSEELALVAFLRTLSDGYLIPCDDDGPPKAH